MRWSALPHMVGTGRRDRDFPVRSTVSRGGGLIGGRAQNSLGSELSIASDGIHYRVLRRGVLPYGDVEHVNLRKTLLGLVLISASGNSRRILAADVGHLAGAQRCWPRYQGKSR